MIDPQGLADLITKPRDSKYLLGLMSRRLGTERLLDDDLVDGVLGDRGFKDLSLWYANDAAGRFLVDKALTGLKGNNDIPGNSLVEMAYWQTVFDDPRFDIIWKRSIEDLKAAPAVTRTSALNRVLSFLSRFKPHQAAASGLGQAGLLFLGAAGGLTAHYAYTNFIQPSPCPCQTCTEPLEKSITRLSENIGKLKLPVTPTTPTDITQMQNQIVELQSKVDALKTYPPTSFDLTETNTHLKDLVDRLGTLKLSSINSTPPAVLPDLTGYLNTIRDNTCILAAQIGSDPNPCPNQPKTSVLTLTQTATATASGTDYDGLRHTLLQINANGAKSLAEITAVKDNTNALMTKQQLSDSRIKALSAPYLLQITATNTKTDAIFDRDKADPKARDHEAVCHFVIRPNLIAGDHVDATISDIHLCDVGTPLAGTHQMTLTRQRQAIPNTDLLVALSDVENLRLWPLPRTTSFIHRKASFDVFQGESKP